jgi:hypothetical protein
MVSLAETSVSVDAYRTVHLGAVLPIANPGYARVWFPAVCILARSLTLTIEFHSPY